MALEAGILGLVVRIKVQIDIFSICLDRVREKRENITGVLL